MIKGLRWRYWLGWGLPVIVLAGGVIIFVLLVATRPQPVEREPAEPHWVVTTTTAEPAAHKPLLRIYGYVVSPSAVTVKSAVEADVKDVPARDGSLIKRDGLLVELDDGELRDVLRQRQAELDELEADLRQERRAVAADGDDLSAEKKLLEIDKRRVSRLERLVDDEAASPSELDDAQEAKERRRQAVTRAQQAVDDGEARIQAAEARRDAAEAARDQARRDVERSSIKSPFRGRISGVEVAAGDRVTPGSSLVEIYDTGDLEVQARIPSPRLGSLQRALAGGVEVAGRAHIDGVTKRVELDRFAGRSPRDQGGVEALFALEGRHDDVALDRFATIELELPVEPQSLVLPYEALYDMDRIFVVGEDDRLREVEVQRLGEANLAGSPEGRQRGALVRVPQLEPGAEIVTTQIPQATDGLRVRVREER
ncbi:efflux RND transporter periplasmic adaptor subunit [Halorhodospira halochloris]|uniref:efflux RND transporter periplasmic adaptor subunit n=1 Tax=Halorhodospira halochloris TaxID=1052 RepID=UPI001EE84602|nr:HlyD family efflux transporter periplasmic adaptor subunit [Halorhodospira halochloris]